MSLLKTQLQSDVKEAMKARDKRALGTLRLIMSELKRREVDERIELKDEDVLAILEKMTKQRRDSLAQYQSAGRQDLADQEQYELDLIIKYMPEPMSESELLALVRTTIELTGASSMADMGSVMGALKAEAQGRADMAKVGQLVKAELG
ncbi:MAG: GatB/YqeY domain-containing protein [Pseudomonadales bacterium]|jgi:uncharacterized protein YqeY|nr:GatB/YqeY domain-containing protein [Pseudomonadales bacterium]MDA0760659.1 GatB/YqeY domain-containing protein [Pseudomonadota bacterium]MDA0958385.1 GatB/YqeY domain-containing protein [Pseudomonadota bacterium]